jgi:hypothetical protein
MAPRLGNALYWLGCTLAGTIFAIDILATITIEPHDPYYPYILAFYAMGAWFIGWVCRRVLAGGRVGRLHARVRASYK